MSTTPSLHMTQFAGKEPNSFQQLSKLVKLKFSSLTKPY